MKRINMSTASTGIAVTALFVALGGPAQAANLISGKDIRNSSITGADVRSSSLTGSDIKNKSLTSADFRGSVKGAKGDRGPAGTNGAAGAPGPRGPEGPSRFVTVNAAGQIEQQSGGFRIANAYPTSGAGVANGANGNVYIESGDKDLTNNGIVATIGLQNQVNQDANAGNAGANDGTDANPEFSGEITATRCAIGTGPNAVMGTTGVVACAPMDVGVTPNVPTNANNYFVVSPRLSDGQRTSDANSPTPNPISNRKRFTVVISGPQD